MSQYTKQGDNFISSINNNFNIHDNVGRVIETNNDTGEIIYDLYSSKDDIAEIKNNISYNTALPLDQSNKYYPLPGELVLVIKGPSSKSAISDSSTTNYYSNIINIWNNTNNNAQYINEDYHFTDKNIPLLKSFLGDKIINGRYGNNIRFSNTNPNQDNFWKEANKGEPINILSITSGSLENIEEDNLFIMSSTQKIPLKTFTSTSNKITQTILPKNSSLKSQFLNAERIVLNTLKDDILLYSNKNVELYSKDNITLNTNRILLDANKICLGQNGKEEPTEPAVLGNQLEDLIRSLIKSMTSFSNKISSAISTPTGTPLITINSAAIVLTEDLQKVASKLEKIKSQTIYLK